MKTRDRIILASLELFNAQGERNVTTNHIAAHLNISPGNLYYHFRNKTDIVYEIFLKYQDLVTNYLKIPEDRGLTVADEFFYLESVFEGLWAYRFFHRDLEYLLECDPRLRRDYRKFTIKSLHNIKLILSGLENGGVLADFEDQHLDSMALNVWLVITNWMAFLKTAHAGEENNAITKEMLKHGIYQVVTLQLPYLTQDYIDSVKEIREKFKPLPFSDADSPL
ncbi:TetR family transcriptional regulator [Oleiphilus messinensis]|uniref:TetR family transcriptional regulator n=1 Tax=Oleiphilus messinensis TaxID=141451 RepID=A0A1Y0IDG9_9GAMM|nr:TetR/AcrR family transcriptional regulator [Oleiphilus messinensis]ARU58572.1 TetR family transcriptional regulator [Oleiphilus messinensis]